MSKANSVQLWIIVGDLVLKLILNYSLPCQNKTLTSNQPKRYKI